MRLQPVAMIILTGLSIYLTMLSSSPAEARVHSKASEGSFIIELSGEIAAPMAEDLKEAIQAALKSQNKNLIVDLNSEGGSMDEGARIIENLRDSQDQGLTLQTRVRNGSQCGSMCIPIFLAGKIRTAGEVATFYFHGALPHLYCTVPDATATQKYLKYFSEAQVSSQFIEELSNKGVFTDPGKYWMTGRELVQKKSNIVHSLISAHEKVSASCIPFQPGKPN